MLEGLASFIMKMKFFYAQPGGEDWIDTDNWRRNSQFELSERMLLFKLLFLYKITWRVVFFLNNT